MRKLYFTSSATDLNNPCGSTPECTLGNGGAGAICSTNCVCDASNDYTEDSSTCKKGNNFVYPVTTVSGHQEVPLTVRPSPFCLSVYLSFFACLDVDYV